MKISIVLIFISVFNLIAGSGYSQDKDISLKLANVYTIENVIAEIEKTTDYVFIYNEDVVPTLKEEAKVDVNNQSLDEILNQLIEGTDLAYSVSSKQVTLYKDESKKVYAQVTTSSPMDVQQPSGKTITGRVTDTYQEPLPGVTVIVKGTTKGTTTDVDGNFILTDVPENTTLQFSFVGMKMQEILIGNQTRFVIIMEDETIGLEEVVAIGYGVSRKVDLTGAVGSVRMDETINSFPTVDFGQALYGKIPGLQVINTTGRPGESSTIQIRGLSSVMAGTTPLLVVDGVPLADYDLNLINSNDIESIDVLKDASSTAIYGSRGANGVILVTTRSGTSGKPKISVDYNYSVQQVVRFAEFMNSTEYAQAAIDAAQNGWITIGGDPNAPNNIEARGNYRYTWPEAFERPETLTNTNWQDLMYRTAPMHKVHVGISGGNEKSDYFFSAGYINQEGIMIMSDYQKISLNLKVNSGITDWLTVGAIANSVFHKENLFPEDGSSFQNITQYPPIYPVYGKDGLLGGPGTVDGYENYTAVFYNLKGHPYRILNDEYKEDRFDWLGQAYAEIKILPALKFRSSFNAVLKNNERSVYLATDSNFGPTYIGTGNYNASINKKLNYSFENFLTYDRTLDGIHNINAIAGYEFNQRNYSLLSGTRTHYDNDLIHFLTAGNVVADASDDYYKSSLVSYLARANYNYKEKYLLSASFRRDGSSKFGPNHKWGNFPSVSSAWRVSEEQFMDNVNFIDNLKIRGSLGYTGNDNIADYVWLSKMNMTRIAFGDNLSTSYYPSSISNPDLKWERTRQYNLGIDIGFINNRIYLEADFYKSISDDLLLDVPIPSTTGFSTIFTNIGELQNKGVELNLVTQNITGKFNWESVITYSANRNKITKMGPDDAPRIYSTGHSMQGIDMVGEPMHQFHGYVFDGVFMNQAEVDANKIVYPHDIFPGDAKYKDVNGDGILDADDRAPIGNPQPDFIWSFVNNFKYKNFDLSFMWQGVVGSDLFNGNYRRSMIYHEGRNYMKRLNDRWRSESEPGDGTVPRVNVELYGFEKTRSSYWITDGTYARLKNVTLGYTLPSKIARKINLASARIYFNGNNLLTFTNAETEDPENFNVRGSLESADGRGVSHGVYPSAKVFTFGINVNF